MVCDCPTKDALVCKEHPDCRPSYCKLSVLTPPIMLREITPPGGEMITIEQLRELVALQAEDEALWAPAVRIETAYVQQGLRWLTHAIEGKWSFEDAREAIKETMS